MHTLLLKFRNSEASEGRDKIYALLAISSDTRENQDLCPDYEKTEQEMVNSTVAFLLGQRQKIDPGWTLLVFLEKLDSLKDSVVEWSTSTGDILIFVQLLHMGDVVVTRTSMGHVVLLYFGANIGDVKGVREQLTVCQPHLTWEQKMDMRSYVKLRNQVRYPSSIYSTQLTTSQRILDLS